MSLGGDLRVDPGDLAVLVEQEGDAVRLFPVLAQHSQRLRRAAALVGEEREVEAVLLAEPAVRLGGVEGDAVDLYVRLLVVAHAVPEGASLLGAPGGIVL